MRKEAVYAVILNVTLFKGMSYALAQDPRYIRFSAIEEGKATHYNLRVRPPSYLRILPEILRKCFYMPKVSSAKMAQELLDEIKSNTPLV